MEMCLLSQKMEMVTTGQTLDKAIFKKPDFICSLCVTQSDRAVKYTDCISAEE